MKEKGLVMTVIVVEELGRENGWGVSVVGDKQREQDANRKVSERE